MTSLQMELVYRTQMPFSPGTISLFWCRVTTAATSSSTVTLRKNSTNANNTISINANTTGAFSDTTYNDSIAIGIPIQIGGHWLWKKFTTAPTCLRNLHPDLAAVSPHVPCFHLLSCVVLLPHFSLPLLVAFVQPSWLLPTYL
jgi:hypothetical protein